MSCWPKQIWAKFVFFKDPCMLTFIKKSSLIVFSHQNIHLMWIFQHNPKNHLISYRYYVYWSWCGQSHCNGILWVPVFGKIVLLSIRYVTDFSIYCEWYTISLQTPKSPRCVLLWPLWLQVHLDFEVTSNHYTCKTIQQHYTNYICASQATIATPINTSQHHCKRLHVLIYRLLSADGYSGSNKQSMHNFQWSDSLASARARVTLRSLLHSGYHDMELRRILKTHLKLLTGKCNEDFFQDNSCDITGILSLLCTYSTTSYCSNHWTTCSLHPWWVCGCQMTGP
jgi:hypothetical protein